MLELNKSFTGIEKVDEFASSLGPMVKAINQYEYYIEQEFFKEKALEFINNNQIPLGICIITTSIYCAGPGMRMFYHHIMYNRMEVACNMHSTLVSYMDTYYNTSINTNHAFFKFTDIMSFIKSGKYDFKTDVWNGAYHNYFNPFSPKWEEIYRISKEKFEGLTIINN